MVRVTIIMAWFALAVGVLSGPASAGGSEALAGESARESARPRVVDDLSRVVELRAPARRVAAASPAAVDLLLSIGVQPVARPWLPGSVPDSWEGIPVIGFDHASGPNLEQLMRAAPDLVVVDVTSARFVDQIESLVGAPVVCIQIGDIWDLPGRIRDLGRLTGALESADERAGALAASFEDHRNASDSAAPTRVFALFGGPRSGYAFAENSYVASMLELVGAEVVRAGGEPHGMFPELGRYSVELLWAEDPDVILVLSHGAVIDRATEMAANPVWNGLRAVRERRVVSLSDELFVMRPGADVISALGVLRGAISSAGHR
jgi:ABC-type Fe3+-hydroxamate transport system substrate-binding protein